MNGALSATDLSILNIKIQFLNAFFSVFLFLGLCNFFIGISIHCNFLRILSRRFLFLNGFLPFFVGFHLEWWLVGIGVDLRTFLMKLVIRSIILTYLGYTLSFNLEWHQTIFIVLALFIRILAQELLPNSNLFAFHII